MKEINFVDYLTKKNVRTLLTLMGLRFINETDEEVPEESRAAMIKKPITRLDGEDGKRLLVVCKAMTKDEIDKIKLSLPQSKELLVLTSAIAFCALSGTNKYYGISSYDDYKFLTLENFFAYESLFVGSEDAEVETMRKLTSIYDKYMENKFGKFYTEQKKKYIKDLKKKLKEEKEEAVDGE